MPETITTIQVRVLCYLVIGTQHSATLREVFMSPINQQGVEYVCWFSFFYSGVSETIWLDISPVIFWRLQTNLGCLSKWYNLLSNKQGQSASLEVLKSHFQLLGILLFERVKISKPRTKKFTSIQNYIEVGFKKKFRPSKFIPMKT